MFCKVRLVDIICFEDYKNQPRSVPEYPALLARSSCQVRACIAWLNNQYGTPDFHSFFEMSLFVLHDGGVDSWICRKDARGVTERSPGQNRPGIAESTLPLPEAMDIINASGDIEGVVLRIL